MNLKITKMTNSIGRKLGINQGILRMSAGRELKKGNFNRKMACKANRLIEAADENKKSILEAQSNYYFKVMILHLNKAIARLTAAEGCRTVSGAQKETRFYSLLNRTVRDKKYFQSMNKMVKDCKRIIKEIEEPLSPV